MWYGEYSHTLDTKDRFILPAKFRDKISDLAQKKFYLTRGFEQCLMLLHHEAWEKLEQIISQKSFTKQDARYFNRMLFSGAMEFEIDAQGRISIPAYLKEHAHIKREITIVGLSDKIEIWDTHLWQAFYSDNRARYEDIAEHLL